MSFSRMNLATAFALGLVARGPAQGGDHGDPAAYLPLTKGNTWSYTTSRQEKATISVDAIENVGNASCAKLAWKVDGRTLREEWLACGKNGLELHRLRTAAGEAGIEPPVFRLRVPVENRGTWEAVTKDPQGNRLRSQCVVEVPSRVQAGGKTYEAVRVSSHVQRVNAPW